MNFERGSPIPRHGNGEFWTPEKPINQEDGIRPRRGSWTAAMLGGPIPRMPIHHGIVDGMESWPVMTPKAPVSMANGVAGGRGSWAKMIPETGIVQNGDCWNQVSPGNQFPQENGIIQGRNSFSPVTPGKSIHQQSNTVSINRQGGQVEKENWRDLLGIYQDLLEEETLDMNGLVQESDSTPPPPTLAQNNRDQNWVVGTARRNLNPILNLNSNPSLSPDPNPNHSSNQESTSFEDPANWKRGLLAAVIRPKNILTCALPGNDAQNNSVQVSDRTLVQNLCSQTASNSVESFSAGSMLRSQQTQITSNQLPIDGFSVPYRHCYNLNSPPRSEADAASPSILNSLPFAPITPDKQGTCIGNQWVPEKVNLSVEEISTPANDGNGNHMVSIRSEDLDNRCNELLQAIGDSSSSAVSTTQKEHIIPDGGYEQGIDLNKTPQQKTPARRKKHRPKVVVEGKPKRTPKPKEASNEARPKRKYVRRKGVNSAENQQGNQVDETRQIEVPQSTGKRKYARKKGVENLESKQQSRVDEVMVPVVESPACKKKLNFDLESGIARDESQDRRGSQQCINLNDNPQDTEQERIINRMLEESGMKFVQQNGYLGGMSNRESSSTNHMQARNRNMSMPEQHFTPIAKTRDHALNVIARNLIWRNSITGQESLRNGYNQVNQHDLREGTSDNMFQPGSPSKNLERAREQMSERTSQFSNGSVLNSDERRGVKRQSFEQMHPRNVNAMSSLLQYQKLFLENHKKNRTESEFQTLSSNEPSRMVPLEDNSRQEARRMNGVFGNGSALQLLNSCIGRVKPSRAMNSIGATADNCQLQPPMAGAQYLQKHQDSTGMKYYTGRPIAERSQISPLETAMVSWTPPQATPQREASRSAMVIYPGSLSEMKQSAKPNSSNQRSNGVNREIQQLRNDTSKAYQLTSTKAKGRSRKQKIEISVDELTYKLEGLHIFGENNKEQNALVPYRGDNSIIPFEPIKKRKPRPKVDLDPETDRLWRLLMGKEGSDGAETLDKDKEKWWEDERRVFRGRADSFIARMHLVQGDRRFSRWKGSVVDSVIGVFLTQNVSDHLSSSAFMSLAAKYPIKSTTNTDTSGQDGACVLVEEPIEIVRPNDSMRCHERIGRQPVFNQNSSLSCESSEHMRNHISEMRATANQHGKISEEEVILSQDSFESSTVITVDEIRSSSGSNSETEDQTTGFETSKECGPPVNQKQAEKVSMFKDLFTQDNWGTLSIERPMHHQSKNLECDMQSAGRCRVSNINSSSRFTPPNSIIDLTEESPASSSHFQMNMTQGMQTGGPLCFGLLGGESISSLPSSNSGMTEAYHSSNVTYPQNEVPGFQAPPVGQYDFLSSHPSPQENFHPEPRIISSQHLNNSPQHGRQFLAEMRGHAETTKEQNTAQKQDSAMCRGTTTNAEDRVSVVDKQNCVENTTEANSKEKKYSDHEPVSEEGTNTLKTRKKTAEDEKKKAFDWDSLRKQVLSNGGKRERTKDASDSLDYEALRNAHVNEISDAIRERGMNNMLADRIKDFLNRLVRDHGSVDLEWLRDVPPDKAKEYLLSIRGLGLKSVECVRLLTLHHLAFPVDTNVGRIAVRLGWVPLQPLPESLQLHLLEMYPVLETIQKYLWPRLCKMDQLTLYELHYQMITFGKVFCTKSKPNCNACPMRAECRHFASAFASARLALPGPEEKRMVTTDAPVGVDRSPPPVSRPMPLPPSENNYNKDAGFSERQCEPIIEEPTTPDVETAELSMSDIEDQYYEDSDEIPTIKLNMEEFTTNLQNIIQDTELQGDMSKALVALNPEAASIPTPKLKNVSRLRTEHQVYELPDSHPLLEGFDKREPDDPSPYLLAIWTPGETANSTQPPERGCEAQESGKLCSRTTCFSCNSIKEANSQVVRGTLLIPCRTAMRGSFPLNGTYFQVNEMFADHASSLNPIDVPRGWIWNLPRRTVYFGTSVTTIFKGLTTEGIQYCFWRGFVCVRGFDQKTRAPRPLMARLHFPASRLVKTKNEGK